MYLSFFVFYSSRKVDIKVINRKGIISKHRKYRQLVCLLWKINVSHDINLYNTEILLHIPFSEFSKQIEHFFSWSIKTFLAQLL